jgi:hypothetical protein
VVGAIAVHPAAHAALSYTGSFTVGAGGQYGEAVFGSNAEVYNFSGPNPHRSQVASHTEAIATVTGLAQGSAGGYVSVQTGMIRAAAQAQATANEAVGARVVYGVASAGARAQFQDSVMIDVPGLPHYAPVTVNALLRVHGLTLAEGTAPDTWASVSGQAVGSMSIQIGNYGSDGYVGYWQCRVDAPGQPRSCGGSTAVPLGGWLPVSFTMFNQKPYDFYLSLDLYAGASAMVQYVPGLQMASALADFGTTLGWGGVTSVLGGQGQNLQGYTLLSSASGFDYVTSAVPVPEPHAAYLLMAGLLTIGTLRHRRRSAAAPAAA